MQNGLKLRFHILNAMIFFCCLNFTLFAWARVSTPPTTPDQQLINPALAALRPYVGLAVNLNRHLDTTTALELINSSLVITTSIDSLNANNVWRSNDYTWELSVVPQSGVKKSVSVVTQNGNDSNYTSENKLTLIPIQGLVSKKVSNETSVGLKIVYSYANFDSDNKYGLANDFGLFQVNDGEKVKGQFLVLGPGVVYQLGSSGFSFSYLAEFMQFINEDTLSGSQTTSGGGTSQTSTTDLKIKDTVAIRKDVVGFGYMTKFSGNNTLRLDFSVEKMPPLSKDTSLEYGQLFRFIGELSYAFFQVGTEVSQKKGYYVDPNNLIPYFFKQDQYNKKAVLEYGFFGGLRTSKGHGFGASYSSSTDETTEPISASGSDLKVEKKNTSYSLSYSYIY